MPKIDEWGRSIEAYGGKDMPKQMGITKVEYPRQRNWECWKCQNKFSLDAKIKRCDAKCPKCGAGKDDMLEAGFRKLDDVWLDK